MSTMCGVAWLLIRTTSIGAFASSHTSASYTHAPTFRSTVVAPAQGVGDEWRVARFHLSLMCVLPERFQRAKMPAAFLHHFSAHSRGLLTCGKQTLNATQRNNTQNSSQPHSNSTRNPLDLILYSLIGAAQVRA